MSELINHAAIHFFIGFGLALLNVVVCYFVPRLPRVISITRWGLKPRTLILAYLIALVLELASSPLFRSYLTSAYSELAWSPFQAIFNVLGVLAIDLLAGLWGGLRRGAETGRKQLDIAKTRAAEELDEVGARLALTPEGRAEHAARVEAQQEAEAQAAAERKQRIDDRLKDY
jgi:hypothetical protein